MTSMILLGLLAAPVFALDQAALDKALDELAAVPANDGKAWVEKRKAVVAFGQDALPTLEAAAAEAKWTESGWKHACAAEVCRLRIARPELAKIIDKPRGIDPAEYQKFRHGKPSCHRDFVHAGKEIVPLLVEAWTWTLGQYTFSEGAAGQLERETLCIALMQAPGEAFDSRAQFALKHAFENAGNADNLRAFAAVSFAQCAGIGALETLCGALDSVNQPAAIREGAGLALGWIAATEALTAIKERMIAEFVTANTEEATRLRRALEVALGNLGGSWAWVSRGADKKPLADEIRKGCSETLVAALKAHPQDQTFITEALCLVAWKDSLEAVRALAKDASATQAQRDAAKSCLALLEMAVAREK